MEAWQTIHDTPGVQDIWQLHFAVAGGKDHNAADPFLANLDEICEGKWIRASTHRRDGSFQTLQQSEQIREGVPIGTKRSFLAKTPRTPKKIKKTLFWFSWRPWRLGEKKSFLFVVPYPYEYGNHVGSIVDCSLLASRILASSLCRNSVEIF